MDTKRITKQTMQYKHNEGEACDVQGKDGSTRFILSVKEERFDGDLNKLLPFLHPACSSVFSECAQCFE